MPVAIKREKMNRYQRYFGSGPRGLLISALLLVLAWQMESVAGLPVVAASAAVRWSIFALSVVGAMLLGAWSLKSLPPAARGQVLTTTGAYRYFRHPLYATFLSSFNFGLAVLLNNWIYILWAVLLHPVWHWNVSSEERLMRREFSAEYDEYCRRTGRFFPRIGKSPERTPQ